MRDRATDFDPATLSEMAAGLSRESLLPILGTFIEESRRRVEEVRAALAEGDLARVELHAHSLKSTAATFGTPALQGHALALEVAAAEGNRAEASSLADRLPDITETAMSAVEAWVASGSG